MNTIYVVTKGSYSDYHIVGVFDNKTLADRVALAYEGRYDRTEVEEWAVNEITLSQYPSDFLPYSVAVYDNGKVYVERTDAGRPNEDDDPTYWEYDPDNDMGGYWSLSVWARDGDHAEKIALDKVAQKKAEDAGVV